MRASRKKKKKSCRLVHGSILPTHHTDTHSASTKHASPNCPYPECAARGASSPSPATLPATTLRRSPYPPPATTPSSLPAPSKSYPSRIPSASRSSRHPTPVCDLAIRLLSLSPLKSSDYLFQSCSTIPPFDYS